MDLQHPMMSDVPVFISGAGPTGMLLALWLTHFNVPFRIVDPNLSTGTTSRAIVVHARVLELYDQLGIADEAVKRGTILKTFAVNYNGAKCTELNVGNAGNGRSKFPFILSLAQDVHEEILQAELDKRGVRVERGTALVGLEQHGDHVQLRVKDREGKEGSYRARFVAGCDGAHSAVRRLTDVPMEGGTYARRFFVADVQADGAIVGDQSTISFCLSGDDFTLSIRMKGEDRCRLIGFVPDELGDNNDIKFDDCLPSIRRNMTGIEILHLNWFSHYKVHHRTAQSFRKGRIFLMGDAAHLHSPVGGQGMNTGLGDATNFAWKIAAAWDKPELDGLLDTYDFERAAFARTLVSTTDTAFTFMTGPTWYSHLLRSYFIPYLLPLALKIIDAAPLVYGRVSQLGISYEQSPMSVNLGTIGGTLKAGQRLPWVPHARDANDEEMDSNLVHLCQVGWQAHAFGKVRKELAEVLGEKHVPLHMFKPTREAGSKGFGEDMIYLVRPDGQIGLVVAPDAACADVEKYLGVWGVAGTLISS